MSIAIQLHKDDIDYSTLGDQVTYITFSPLNSDPEINEAVIDEGQYAQIEAGLEGVPHKVDFTGTGRKWQAVNGAGW
ncbi:hypothetical protein [Burkholderia multivorans]|uniref:Bacteriophage protein n=1 Tax=Burkholderia multivorans TaxID=87883 RepID=A0AB37ALZ6_9BURK|nr:hypothetical protein [Burkholderia multivorans]MBU9589616.1 hypothetical protein [Burkholderia multivorans]PRE39309.1 hypothetical protein C6P97_30985 [Burkholderia multivorans]PRE42271.1 hypothetical protein C6P99_24620 [Burkholderia multivorans]